MNYTYEWVAFYRDGSSIRQIEKGKENKWADIDKPNVEIFCVVKTDGSGVALAVHIEEGERLIYRQRVRRAAGKPEIRVWMVGTQKTVNGKNVQKIAFVFPDGHVEITNGFKENTEWAYPPGRMVKKDGKREFEPCVHDGKDGREDEGEEWVFE